MEKDSCLRMQDFPTLKAHPYFANLVDWQDIQSFIDIPHPHQLSPDDLDLVNFYSNNYHIQFYLEDIRI